MKAVKWILILVAVLLACALTAPVSGQEPTQTPTPVYNIYLPLVVSGFGPSLPTPTPTNTSTPVPTATPRPSGTVEVVSSSTYWVWTSDLKVVGEVINNTASKVEWIEVTGVLRDANGYAVRTAWTYAMTTILEPGQKAPFKMYFFDAPMYASYGFIVDFDTTPAPAHDLEVLSATVSGDLYITGEVRNNHDWKTYEWVEVAATLYNTAGTVVDCEYTYTTPEDLGPGASGVYQIGFWDAPAWTSYAVITYGWPW